MIEIQVQLIGAEPKFESRHLYGLTFSHLFVIVMATCTVSARGKIADLTGDKDKFQAFSLYALHCLTK